MVSRPPKAELIEVRDCDTMNLGRLRRAGERYSAVSEDNIALADFSVVT